ncbi:trypco2 family protein [Streptomyces sp. bgisy027]|uniref:trypco2 family protein n=1 Tax=Streptomyces sp. bgisy027 TaxID=3413770 RepID=UPI003D760544
MGLAEAVRAVRKELAEAIADGEGSAVRFDVGPVELEFTVDVRKEHGVDGGVRVWVLSAGGRGKKTSGNTHRMHVSLTPVTEDGQPVRITSQETAVTPR